MSSTTRHKKSRIVRKHWSEFKQPTKRELEAIRERAKGPIDTSDSPPITDEDLASGRVRIVKRRPKTEKVSLTIRLDADVVERFKADGEGYQTRINEALREYLATTGAHDVPQMLDQIATLATQVRRRIS